MSATKYIALESAGLIQPIEHAGVWNLLLAWIMLPPLYYFSANGVFIPSSGDTSIVASSASSTSHMATAAIVMLVCSILIASRFPYLLSDYRRMKVFLAFPLLAVFSFIWSSDPRQSFVSGTILLIFTLFALYIANRFSWQEQFELIILVGAVILPLSIALAIFVPAVGESGGGWSGIFGQKQNCAIVSMLWLVTAIHWKTVGLHQKLLRVTYILMCVLLIVMSRSRTGWALALIALLLSAVIWIMQKVPAKQSLLFAMLSSVIAGGLVYAVYLHSTSIITSVGKDPTLSQRTSIWAAVWIEILKHPILGYGFAAFWKGLFGPSHDVVVSSGWDVFQAQDGFLDVWLGVGVVGIALVAMMVVQAIRNAIRSFRGVNATYVRWCIVIIISTLLLNIGESTIGRPQMGWFLFLLAYIGLNQVAQKARTSGNAVYWIHESEDNIQETSRQLSQFV
jgi:exopolysaccharide production protein ExoQ